MFKPNFRRTDLLIELIARIEVARDRILRACIVPRWEAELRHEALVRSARHHRLGEGGHTACEAACPARAIHVGTTDEISAMVGKKAAERAGKEKRGLLLGGQS